MSRSLLRTALELRSPITRLPPTFLLPSRASWLSTATTQQPSGAVSPPPPPPPSLDASPTQQTSTSIQPAAQGRKRRHLASLARVAPQSNTPRTPPTQPPAPPSGPIPDSVKQLLPLLRTQASHYITIHIHGRPYLVTPGDSIRLPFLMPGVSPGDVLRFNRASVLGSRDFTLRPTQPEKRTGRANEVAYIDERVYECRATVMGVDSEPMRSKEKTKRRNRKVKTIKSKHRYTVVRISELKIKRPEEVAE